MRIVFPLTRIGLVVVTFALTISSMAVAGDDSENAEMAEMMQAWEAYMTPGAEHAEIARRAGNWKTTVTMWQKPDSDPEITTGSSTVEVIMGGRYALERFSGATPWGDFEGLGIMAFDNFSRQYTAIWIDTMSTGILRARSTSIAENSIEYASDMPNPLTSSYDTARSTETWIDDDTRKMISFATTPDGIEYPYMEILYKRQQPRE